MKTGFRAQQIIIDAVRPSSPPMISLLIQELQFNQEGEITAITGDVHRIYKKSSEVTTQTVELEDPVTGLTGIVSIAGIDAMLRAIANRWTAESLNCEIDPITGWAVRQE